MNLYKFRSVDERSLEALAKSHLYFAKSNMLNDPTENMFRFLDSKKNDKYSPNTSTLSEMGILSMAIGEQSLIEASPFMWAHYGDQLKGFCLVFNYDDFVSDIEDKIEKFGSVNYREFPHLLSGDNLINENYGIENVAGTNFQLKNLHRVYEACFFDKPAEFEHEREFRFLAKGCGNIEYNHQSLRSVIIGERMDSNDRTELLLLLKKLGIQYKVKEAKVKENSFQVHIVSNDSYLL